MKNMTIPAGSVILTPDEVARLQDHIFRWKTWGDTPSLGAMDALIALGLAIKDILDDSTPLEGED